jgi:hypothetical protein
MASEWLSKDTTVHQDHVIAHVLGARVLGYFIFDEALHLLLDMGFIWTVYVDGEMGLLPQAVAIGELEAEKEMKRQLLADIDILHDYGRSAPGLVHMIPAPVDATIEDVSFFINGDERRIVLKGNEPSLAIETSLRTAEIKIEVMSDE